MTDWAHSLHATLQRHPWLVDAVVGPRVMGPNELTWIEGALRALDGSGLSGAEQMDAVTLLSGHIRDIARHARASGPSGSPEGQILGCLTEVLHDHPDRYPALAAALASPAGPQDRDQALEFGLERILDGLAALIARRRTG
ncbi:TetR/AcrR family transcriptional regulator C-terminal domain-containing protein [Streptomyces sp. NPDC059740]|uniref:TetR/AcrR family transcriptional regulator C-terminal domain-containing protein n=1 Tax=Streptomyces sp. NPDC059740 TaxID=3346926 RepID=UPI0036460B95